MVNRKLGVMLFNEEVEEWQIWVDHTCFSLEIYDEFEIKIEETYYEAHLENWHERIKLKNSDVIFNLIKSEIYKVIYEDKEELVPKYY